MYDKSKRTWSQRLKITKIEKAQSTTSSVTTSSSSPNTSNPTVSKRNTTASTAFAKNEQINASHEATTQYQNLMAMHSPTIQLKQFSDYQSSLVRGGSISGDPLRVFGVDGMSYEYLPNAISRSIKYSEPWIYGTVRGIPARPYHHYQQVAAYGHPHAAAIFAPNHALTSSEAVAVVICSCPEYLKGTKRDLKKASICKKCKGSRLPLATMGGTMRVATTSGGLIPANKVRSSGAATMRLVTVSKKARPSILDPQKDPYDLMRRTRLLSPEPGAVGAATALKDKSHSRGKSESPVRGRSRTRSQAPSKTSDNVVASSDSQDCWLVEDTEILLNAATPSTPSFTTSRRSILRCNVNPYDLISINTPQSSAAQKSTNHNPHILTSKTEKNYRSRLGSSHNEFMAPNDDFNVGDAALADEAPPFATSNASKASLNDRGIAVTVQAIDCNDAAATAKFKYKTKDELKSNSNQNNYNNVQAIAGKRISLGERKSIEKSLIQQTEDSFSYESIIVDEAGMMSPANIQVHSEYESMDESTTSKEISKQNVLHSANTKYAKPQRPPRTRRQDSVNSNADVADTDTDAESEKPNTKINDEKKLILQITSHTDTVTAGVTPTQQIKSILKRPSTRSPDITLTVNSCLPTSFEKNISDNDNFSQEKLSNTTIDEGNATSVTVTPLLTKSQFYIPLPQSRKKVQFMVEDKVCLQSDSEQPSRKEEVIDDTVVKNNDYERFSSLQSTCKYEYYSKKQAQRKQKSDQIQNNKIASISADNENQTQKYSSAIDESLKSYVLCSEKLMTINNTNVSFAGNAQLETTDIHVEENDSEGQYFDADEALTLTLVNLKNTDSNGVLYEDVVPFADLEQQTQQQQQQSENKRIKSNNNFVETMSELAVDTTDLKSDVSGVEIVTKSDNSIITANETITSNKKTTIEKEQVVTGTVTSKSNQTNQSQNPIRRAHSERQLTAASNKLCSTNERTNNRDNHTRRNRSNSSSEQNSRSNTGNNLNFKDTTALRFKHIRAVLDSRELFTHTTSSTPLNSRPKEPPPPPPPTDILTTEVTPEKTLSTSLTKSKNKKKLKESNHLHLMPTGSMQHNVILPRVDARDDDSIHAHKNAVTAEIKYKRINTDLNKRSESAASGSGNEQQKQHHQKQKGKPSSQQKKQQQQEQSEEKSQMENNIQSDVANKGNDSSGSETSITEDKQRRSNKNSFSNKQHQQHQQDNKSVEVTTNQAITFETKKGTKIESIPLRRHQQQQSHQQRTVVRVAPFNSVSTEVHRLKISHTDADLHKPSSASLTSSSNGRNHHSAHANEWEEMCTQKKTSILINGDDCYSTMNLSSDASTPLYQSSVVVADYSSLAENSTNKLFASTYAGLKMTTTSNTVTINVSSPRTNEEEIIYQNNKINSILSRQVLTDNDLVAGPILGGRAVIPIRETAEVNLQRSASSTSSTSTSSMTSNSSGSGGSCGGSLPKRGRTLIKLDYEKEKNLQLQQNDAEKSLPQETILEEETHNLELMSHEEELLKILRNPVEAVKRNLVPHVCGRQESLSDQDNARKKKMKDGNKDISIVVQNTDSQATTTTTTPAISIDTSLLRPKHKSGENSPFIMKLLEDPMLSQVADGLETETIAELIENSLKRLKESRNTIDISGTKDSEEMNRLINISLEKIKEERQFSANNTTINANTFSKSNSSLTIPTKEEDRHSNRGSISSANSFASANNYEMFDFDANESDCYQSCSSEITTAGDDDAASSAATRSKFYQMLVDATLAEIEMSTNVEEDENDHHYESIRNNGDPIYEEISDIPPPLPLSAPPLNDPDLEKKTARSIFEGASKYDILSYLVDAKERGLVREESFEYPINCTNPIIIEEEASDTLSDLTKRKQLKDMSSRASILSDSSDETQSNMSSLSPPPNNFICGRSTVLQRKGGSNDIERNDSGVGSETSKCSRNKYQSTLDAAKTSILNENIIHVCEDCEGPVETQRTETGAMFAPLVCRKCGKKRVERKEIITEIVETEEKYGRDLQIILEEFCHPMLVAGLLTQEQLSAIFLNTEELLENNQTLAERMRDGLDIALEQGDDDLLTVNIGKIFLDFTQMLHAFERYCVRQAGASLLLANLEKEKELLRIFLKVSQMENAVLRRMNLNSFLMVPVQRVTKYPLLLARLYKVTPLHLEGRDLLKQAQEKIELHLNHINQEAKDVPTKLWRRISSSSPNRRASCEIDMINIKLRKMAIDILEWNHDEVRFAMEGKLLYTQPTDNNWKKARTIKLTPVNALLVTNGKPSANYKAEKVIPDKLNFPKHTGIREASLLVVKEKCGRYTLLREPLYLDRCIVCSEADWDDYFEVQEISSKDTFIFKAEDSVRTKQWYTQLQYHAQGMGAWRKRRNALANIMINGMLARS